MTGEKGDTETTDILEILRGAAAGANDPDVALAELLVAMSRRDPPAVHAVLAQLIRDAHRD